jgi:hypothetical protein
VTGTLRRLLCAAALVGTGSAPAWADPLPVPVVKVTRQQPVGTAAGPLEIHLAVTNWQAFAASLFEPAPTQPPCGPDAANNGSRSAIEIFDAANRKPLANLCGFRQPQQMQDIVFAVASAEKPRLVYAIVTDRKLKRRAISAKVKVP